MTGFDDDTTEIRETDMLCLHRPFTIADPMTGLCLPYLWDISHTLPVAVKQSAFAQVKLLDSSSFHSPPLSQRSGAASQSKSLSRWLFNK